MKFALEAAMLRAQICRAAPTRLCWALQENQRLDYRPPPPSLPGLAGLCRSTSDSTTDLAATDMGSKLLPETAAEVLGRFVLVCSADGQCHQMKRLLETRVIDPKQLASLRGG